LSLPSGTRSFGFEKSSTPDQPPVFGTTPTNPSSVTTGQTFTYNATATDPESDYPLVFDLPVHPVGMAVDPQLGVVFWQPTPDQAGQSATVLLRVTDTKGSVALQSFTVNVVAANNPPVISSTPVTTAINGVPYQYAVQAQDPDSGETLTYSLTGTPPSGMTINSSTGVISWPNPTFGGGGGHYSVSLQVADNGQPVLTAAQSYSLTVTSGGTEHAPVINSTPRTSIEVGQLYLYVLQATDQDNDPLTYSLTTKPTGMGFATGAVNVVTWTPTASQIGNNSVTVQVSDGRSGGTVTQSFTITVYDTLVNHAPTITSIPPFLATVGQVYAYNAAATDPDNDSIAWKLLKAPAGMSLSANLGTVRWTPAGWQEPSQTVTLEAVDPYGGMATQTWTIQLYGTNQPPVITSTPGA